MTSARRAALAVVGATIVLVFAYGVLTTLFVTPIGGNSGKNISVATGVRNSFPEQLNTTLVEGRLLNQSTGVVETTPANITITMYYSPSCRCCEKYRRYLESSGVRVEAIKSEGVLELKKEKGIPRKLWSCHTMVLENYFIEGHVPLGAILKLLEEKPKIDGIALPGMPSGAPGIGGSGGKTFKIYAVSDGNIVLFTEA